MPAPKKILLLITNLGPGGAQKAFYEQSKELSKEADVIEAVFDKEELPDLFSSQNPLFSLSIKSKKGLVGKAYNFFKRPQKLRRLIKEEGVHICISHMDGANWVNILSRSPAKKILIVHGTIVHDQEQQGYRKWMRQNLLIPYLYNKATVTVAVSEGIRMELQKVFKIKNVVAIPNAFDLSSIQQKALERIPATEEALFADYKILITSGRFHEQKKQQTLFAVFKEVKKTFTDVKLVLLGDGALRNSLLDNAGEQGLATYNSWSGQVFSCDYDVYFLGYKKNPFSYFAKSTLFLFPSGWEGWPLALCEAMICGLPVLAADCPTGPREILAPGTFDPDYKLVTPEKTPYGYLLPMQDKQVFGEVWKSAIEELLLNKQARITLGNNGKIRMKEFDKEVIYKKWHELIDTLYPPGAV